MRVGLSVALLGIASVVAANDQDEFQHTISCETPNNSPYISALNIIVTSLRESLEIFPWEWSPPTSEDSDKCIEMKEAPGAALRYCDSGTVRTLSCFSE